MSKRQKNIVYGSCGQYSANAHYRITRLTAVVESLSQEVTSILNQLAGGGFQGSWNADTNVPTLSDNGGGGVKGDYYVVSVPGTTTIDGNSTWNVGDEIVHNGSVWERVPNTQAVISVNGKTGAVVLDKTDIGLSNVDNMSVVQILNDSALTGETSVENVAYNVKQYVDADGFVHDLGTDGRVYNTVTHTLASTVQLPVGATNGTVFNVINEGTGLVTVQAQAPNELDTLGVAASVGLSSYLDKIKLMYVDNVWNIGI